ncbi:MAG TPA: hypothetical protein VKB54_07025 [Solirubrobacteraceae bacterium]|nr:hypothetical protein [Solirubrobacteraceae bacterium]
MTDNTHLLPGVDQHGSGYRVRLSFNGRPYIQTGLTSPDQANELRIQWGRLRDAGLTPAHAPREETLAEACEALLARKRTTVSRKTKRRLRRRGIEWWERATRPWREGDFASTPLSLLDRNRLEDRILARALETPKTARDELDGLKAALRLAGSRNVRFDPAILTIERPVVTPRQRRAADAHQLELLADLAPPYAQRMLRIKGTVGNRFEELATLTDDRVDLEQATIFIPAHLCKEGEDKTIDLTREEVHELRHQLLERAPGTPLVFPTKTGRPWRHYQFLRLVWYKARARADHAWRETHGLDEQADTPFLWRLLDPDGRPVVDEDGDPVWDGLKPHDLRATAATLMRDAGFPKEEAAARLGHADSGALTDRLYDQGDRRARVRRAIDEHAPHGLRAATKSGAPRPSAKPAATPLTQPSDKPAATRKAG